MSRGLLLTSTFYGTWLPGDRRGFVGRVRDARADDSVTPSRVVHDQHGTPYDRALPGLHRASAERLRDEPVYLDATEADVLLKQFSETATFRNWRLLAAAVMANHVHLVVVVRDLDDPTKVLGDFKAYGSRALTARFGKHASGTWWTYGGSKRRLPDDRAVRAAVNYVVRKQHAPLATYEAEPEQVHERSE